MTKKTDPWQGIDEALGLVPRTDPALREAFTDAGFDEEATKRGIAMMRSGLYFNFTDAATTLARAVESAGMTSLSEGAVPPLRESRIREAAAGYERRLVEQKPAPTKTPFGRPLAEDQAPKSPFGRPVES